MALYAEGRIRGRRVDDATRITLVRLAQLIDWRPVLTIVQPDTLIRTSRRIPALLAVAVEAAQSTADSCQSATAHCHDGDGECHVGRRADRGPIDGETRRTGLATNGAPPFFTVAALSLPNTRFRADDRPWGTSRYQRQTACARPPPPHRQCQSRRHRTSRTRSGHRAS